MLEFLARQILRQALKHAGKTAIGDDIEELNGPEAYADRIKRDFHLSEYADAQALYDGDRAYWEQYYRALPAPDWKSEIVRDSAAAAGVPSRNNVFEYGFPDLSSSQATDTLPSDRESALNGRFAKWGSAPGNFAAPPASDGPDSFDNRFGNWGSRPANSLGENSSPVLRFLEQYHSAVAPAVGEPSSGVPLSSPLAPALPAGEPQATVTDQPMRYLGRRVAGEPTVFDTGAPPLPFTPSLAPLLPGDVPQDPAGDEQDRLWFLQGWR